MTRPIKFRAWDKQGKEMFRAVMLSQMGDALIASGRGGSAEIDKDTILMQFTGLLDKNGFEIYEGDVVLIPDEETEKVTDEGQGPTDPYNHFSIVEYENGTFKFRIKESCDIIREGLYSYDEIDEQVGCSELEIIGNVWENPELIK